MSWYKKATEYAYHGTDSTQIENIKMNGLNIGSFFSNNENDISSYADGVWLRFPFPKKYEVIIGRGDYYTTLEVVPSGVMEIKTDFWKNYQKI